jgi:Flp pilus assembly protein TadB
MGGEGDKVRENNTAPRGRETVLVAALAILFGVGLFWFLLLITGWLVIAVLAAAAVIAVMGGVHYLLWGRAVERGLLDRQRAEELWDAAWGRGGLNGPRPR